MTDDNDNEFNVMEGLLTQVSGNIDLHVQKDQEFSQLKNIAEKPGAGGVDG